MEGKSGAIRRERLRAATLRDGGRGYFDPYPRVREKIDQGRKKFGSAQESEELFD